MQPALRALILLACAGIVAILFTHPFACSACGSGASGAELSLRLREGGYLWAAAVSLVAVCTVLAQRRASVGAGKRNVLIAGAVLAAAGPLVVCILGGLSLRLPGCSPDGSGGPAYGCSLPGVGIDPIVGLVTPAFLVSFFTVPAGLLLMLFGALWPRAKAAPASPEVAGPSAEALDAVQAALVSYRGGVQVRARCPNCRSVLLLRRSQTRSAAGAGCVDVACACRTCDGTYEVRAARRA